MSDLELFLNLSMVIVAVVYALTYAFITLADFEKDNGEVKLGSREYNRIQSMKYEEAVAAVSVGPVPVYKRITTAIVNFYYKII